MKAFTYIIARFYQARAARAYHAYVRLTKKAEKFFLRIDGGKQ